MLYRHAHALLELEGTDAAETVGRTFRIVPADGDASDAEQSFVLWSTLSPRGEVPGKPDAPDDKAPEATAELVLEVSADGTHWVALDPHTSPQIAQVVRVPFLLPFVRAQVRTRGMRVGARAVLLGASPFALHPVAQRTDVIVVAGEVVMKISLKMAFAEDVALRLLNWLAQENARILRARPDLPGLYASGVRYRREPDEVWCDYLTLLAVGHEDCDGLAAARAGELLARGGAALTPKDSGYREGRRMQSIPAEVLLLTTSGRFQPGLYHCVVRYRVGGRWHRDDPSARLGMPVPDGFAGEVPMRMLKAISMKRYQAAVGRSFRAAGSAGRRFAGLGWGAFANLGPHLRIQAATGHRAAVVELRPGLYLVADVPSEHLKPEFGVFPLLVPLMVTAAQAAMKGKKRKPRPPQLPGPVADWADDEDVDAVIDPEVRDD